MIERERKHLYTSDQKTSWWGLGEWVEEEDDVTWEYRDVKCRILRVAISDGPSHVFGGHLCGYVQIPKSHPWNSLNYGEIDCSVHWGITYKNEELDGFFWIGFDCAHSGDVCPSTEMFYRTSKKLLEFENKWRERLPTAFKRTYRNIAFCIGECESLVDQMLGQPLNDDASATDVRACGSDNDCDESRTSL